MKSGHLHIRKLGSINRQRGSTTDTKLSLINKIRKQIRKLVKLRWWWTKRLLGNKSVIKNIM